GPADNSRNSSALEQPCFSPVGYDRAVVGAGELARQLLGWRAGLGDEAGNAGERPCRDVGAGMNLAKPRQQIGGYEALDAVSDRQRILPRQRPKFPGKLAVAWDDVHRRAAGDSADVEAGIGRLEAALGT